MPQKVDFASFLNSSDAMAELLESGDIESLLGYRVKSRRYPGSPMTGQSMLGSIELLDLHGNVRNVQPATPREVEMYQLLKAFVGAVRRIPDTSSQTDKAWRCSRCEGTQWVRASLTGPVESGGRAIKQCIPCGHYSNDPADA